MSLILALCRSPVGARLPARSPLRLHSQLRFASQHKAPAHARPDLSALKRRQPTAAPTTTTGAAPAAKQAGGTRPSSAPEAVFRGPKATLTSYAYMRDLARKTAPTTLYKAPSHFWMYLSSWATGVFCFSYAGYHMTTIYYNPPDGLAWYVPKMFGVICVAMGALGCYYILRSANIVNQIRVLPAPAASRPAGGAAAGPTAAQLATQKITQLPLEIEVKRMLPLLAPRVVRTTTAAVTMDGTLARPLPQYLSEADRMELLAAEERARAEAIQYEKDHLMTAPFRHFGRGAQTAWHGVKQALIGSGFVKVKVEGEGKGTYKLDVTNGLALNEGRVLDRLVKIEVKEKSKGLQLYRS